MKLSPLKTLRIIAALLFFIPIVLFFCDFAAVLPKQLHGLAHIQIVPAVLAGSAVISLILFLLTLFFGRIYCSVICPMGILQDFIARLNGKGKRKNKKKRWYHYSKPQNYLRYGLLALCVALLVFGIITPLLFLDPYSNFGRIATNLFRPLIVYGNNLINALAVNAGNYSLYHVTIHTVTAISLTAGMVAFTVVAVMSFLRGRLFCNTICPVGSFLGLISRYSVFRIAVNKVRCNGCGLCERACKSQCIDSKNHTVDASRCVACFNCTTRCRQKAIAYQFSWKRDMQPIVITESYRQDLIEKPTLLKGRRSFLAAGTAIAATIPFIPALAQVTPVDESKRSPITPPGSKNLKRFKEKCTGCHLCVTHCPQQILKPAGFTFGLGYLLKPHMVYEHAYCNYECDICSKVCPNGAIVPFEEKDEKKTAKRREKDEKKTTQIGIARFTQERCVVYNDGTDCGACSEHCPTQAVRMLPYKDDLRLPHVTPELCIGCGGCEYICPVRPLRAINVVANAEHQLSHKPEEEEIKQVEVEDFGF